MIKLLRKINLGVIIYKLREYKRIVTIAKKPTMEEFKRVAYITGLGTIIIGAVGFIVQTLIELLSGKI